MRAQAAGRLQAPAPLVLALTLLLALQLMFWTHTHRIEPAISIVDPVPGEASLEALSLGDTQSFFRAQALMLQQTGDTFGRFTALFRYDYAKLGGWFALMDRLDRESNYVPAMASYYYSQSQNPEDVRAIITYLDQYSAGRTAQAWWWRVQAVYLAQHRLGDLQLALALAQPLIGERSIPIWAQQLPAFIHEQRGEMDEAAAIIEAIAQHPQDYSTGELNFMRYFVEERLGKLEKMREEFDALAQQKRASHQRGEPEPIMQPPPVNVGAPKYHEYYTGPAVKNPLH